MEASVEAAVLLVLGLSIVLIGYYLVIPSMEEKQKEALYIQARNIALEIQGAIESVAFSGRGARVTISLSLPSQISIIAGTGAYQDRAVDVVLYNPPVVAGGVELSRGSVTSVVQEPAGSTLKISVRALSGWQIVMRGLVPSGSQVSMTVTNEGGKVISLTAGGV